MTAREAMAYGRAVVASDTGGLRDAITNGETGHPRAAARSGAPSGPPS